MRLFVTIILWLSLLVAVGLLRWLSVGYAPLNQDEGWYAMAALHAQEGLTPYGDFAFTQGPLWPWVYGHLAGFVSSITGFRWVTASFGVLALVPATLLAARLSENRKQAWVAAWTVVVLCGLSPYLAQFGATVKTYSLAAALLTTGCWCWALAADRERSLGWAIGAGLLLALAGSVRLSLFPACAMAGLLLPWVGGGGWKRTLVLWAAGAVTTLAVYLPIWLQYADAWWFFQVSYHTGRDGGLAWDRLVGLGGHLARLMLHLPLLWILLVGMILLRREEAVDSRRRIRFGLLLLLAPSALLHWLAPFPYDDYQVPLIYAVTAVVAAAVAPWFVGSVRRRTGLLVVAAGMAIGAPAFQQWFVVGRDTIAWQVDRSGSLARLQQVANDLKEVVGDDPVWTMDATVAVEAGLDVPDVLSMGVFSYYPDLPAERARDYGVLSAERMEEDMAGWEGLWVLESSWTFAVAAPAATRVPPADQTRLIGRFTASRQSETTWPNPVQEEGGVLTLWKPVSPDSGTSSAPSVSGAPAP